MSAEQILPGRRPILHWRSLSRSEKRRLIFLWAPSTLVAIAVLLPLGYLIFRALTASNESFQSVFRFSTIETFFRTAILTISVTAAASALSIVLAWLTSRTNLPARNILSVLLALPLVVPSYVGAYLFVAALGPRGLLQQWTEPYLGIERLPSIYGFPGAFMVLAMLTYPYIYLPVRAAMLTTDPALEESARSLGHRSWFTFRTVVLPQLQPAIAAGAILVALYVIRDFGAVSILRYNTFTRVIYLQYQALYDRGSAALLALMLLGFAVIVLWLEFRTRTRGSHHRKTSKRRPPSVLDLAGWKWPAFLFCLAVLILALALPAMILMFWLVRGLMAGESLNILWIPAWNSFFVSMIAALITLLVAAPIAFLVIRRPGRLSTLLERVSHTGFALPGLVIALALVFVSIRFASGIYQTFILLILAYIILFLPQASGALRSSLMRIHPSLDEAARSLGQPPFGVLRNVTLPLLMPGILVGAALVFLTTMKELPVTLILAPFGFKTLATVVWSSVTEAYFARAAAPALLIIVLSAIPLTWIIYRQRGYLE